MNHYAYRTQGVCPNRIEFDLEGDIVKNVVYNGGCNGNLKAIGLLVEGMTVDQINKTLAGNTCGFKNTSCADQLAKAVKAAYDQENA